MLLDHRTKVFHIHSYTLHRPQKMKEPILPVEPLVLEKEPSINENIATSKQRSIKQLLLHVSSQNSLTTQFRIVTLFP